VRARVEWRLLDAKGVIVGNATPHTPNTDRSVATSLINVGEGFLLNVQLRATTSTPRVGQVYAILDLVRGTGSTIQPLATLWSGYVTDTTPAGWPGILSRYSTDGFGVLRSITGTDPAANVEISEACPTNARWRLLAIRFSLVTDANAANREVALTIDDGTNVYARSPSRIAQAASLTRAYTFGINLNAVAAAQDTEQTASLVPVTIQGGHRFNTVTTNRQATDNYGAPQYLVEEWIED
jgi:hypothetical protein